eukprot:6463407-Heterocapsa_arctica.AAC.1
MGFNIVAIDNGGLRGVSTTDEFARPQVAEQVALRDALKGRAIAHEYLEEVDYLIYVELTEVYIRAYRKRQPDMIRGPTLNELRLVDRLIHTY